VKRKSKNKAKAVSLTELEGSVLGMIEVKGPCTPYALRREFMDSPSHYWSASSGAVYPLVLRLEKRGLIRVKGTTDDGREGKLFVLTASGSTALKNWLSTLDAPASISVPPDPLRNRIAFFGVLDPKERRRRVDSAIKAMQIHLERVLERLEREKAEHLVSEQLVSDGARRMLESRLEWLWEVARSL
jgi:DNA-binding PadR family transcriptional regulator